MQSVMNLKIKYRESFRPFAPSVLREYVADWFELDYDSPYMLLVADVNERHRRRLTGDEEKLWGIDKLNVKRSEIPAVTHVDYSARIQTVRRETNSLYWEIIDAFRELTGCPLIVNTSFNVRGEPIVCSPEDSYRCFMRTEMDYLVLENFVLDKQEQPALDEKTDWRKEFSLIELSHRLFKQPAYHTPARFPDMRDHDPLTTLLSRKKGPRRLNQA
jgi:carbamoyltransferase